MYEYKFCKQEQLSFLRDYGNFRNAKDKPLNYARIMTESLTDSNSQQHGTSKFSEEMEKPNAHEKLPPPYQSVM